VAQRRTALAEPPHAIEALAELRQNQQFFVTGFGIITFFPNRAHSFRFHSITLEIHHG
jgi:hypothetical protein